MGIDVSTGYRVAVLATFVVYTIILVAIVVAGQRARKKAAAVSFEKSYFAGGRQIGGLTLGIMMMASMLGSGMFIGFPGTAYKIGFIFAMGAVYSALSIFLVLGGMGKKMGIIARRTNSVSLIGMMKNRYNNNKVVVALISLSFIIFLSTYSATNIIGGARLFETMTGSSYIIGLLLFGAVVGVYSVFGGMKSVAKAALFQGLVMLAAVVFLIFGVVAYLNHNYGGVAELFKSTVGTPAEYILSPYSKIFSPLFVISLYFMSTFSCAGLPHIVQGNMTYKDTRSIKGALIVGAGVATIINTILPLIGPITRVINPNLASPDYATPFLTFTVLPGPISGVMLSGVAAAIQSTIAAMMLIICSTIAKDFYKDIVNPKVSDKQLKKVSLSVLVLVTIIIIIMSIKPPELLQLLVFFAMGGLGASLACPLIIGLYWKRANEYGGIAGIVCGIVSYILLNNVVPQFALGMHPFVVATLISAIAVVVVSLLTPQVPKGVIEVWFGKSYNKEFATRS